MSLFQTPPSFMTTLHIFKLLSWFLLTPVATLYTWTLFLVIVLPLIIVRKVIELLVRHQNDTISSILSPSSTFVAADFDSWTTRPTLSLAVLTRLEGEIGLSEWQQVILRVVGKRDSNTNELAYPELQQCVVKRRGYLFFKWDPNFDIANHVKYYSSPDVHETTEVDEDKLMEIWAEVTHRPFHSERSPWDILIIRNYVSRLQTQVEKQTVMIWRFHHCLADGLSLIRLACEASDTGIEVLEKRLSQHQLPPWFQLGLILKGLIFGPSACIWEWLHFGVDTSNELHSNITLSRTEGLHIVTGQLDVGKVKQAKNLHGVSFLTVVTAGLSGGIREFMKKNNMPLPEGPFKMMYPTIWPQHSKRLTNKFLTTLITLPVDVVERSDRLQVCQERVEDLQGGLLPASYLALRIAGIVPPPLRKLLATFMYQQVSTALSQVIIDVSENRLEFVNGIVSLKSLGVSFGLGPSRIGFACSAVTYADKLMITLTLDKGTFPTRESGEQLLELILKEVEKLGNYGSNIN